MNHGSIDLRCEYQQSPLGLGRTHPRFFWRIEDSRRGAVQSAFQVQVATSLELLSGDDADVWDSGQVQSAQTTHIEYAGAPLESQRRYWWRVRTWDAAKTASIWSRTD